MRPPIPPLAIQRAVSLPGLLPTSLRPTSCYPHHDYDLHFEHPVTPNTLQRLPSTARLHRRPVQTNVSPVMSPRVGPRAQTQGIGTVLGGRLSAL
jgi:hypothetical protein